MPVSRLPPAHDRNQFRLRLRWLNARFSPGRRPAACRVGCQVPAAPGDRQEKELRLVRRDTAKLIGLLGLPLVLIAVFHLTGLSEAMATEYRPAWEAWSDGHHGWASALLFVIFAVTTAAGIPRVYPAILMGGFFSIPLAVAVAVGGAAVGSMAPFLAARRVGPPVVQRKFGRRYRAWVERINSSGFWLVLLLRLFPASNAMLVNMVCGVSRIDPLKFLGATAIGILPSTVAFVLLGGGLTRNDPGYLAISIGTLLALFVASWLTWRNMRHGGEGFPGGPGDEWTLTPGDDRLVE